MPPVRVISGTHRGRRLRSPDTPDTRPVTDRVKESIFSSIGTGVVQARVADLYAGAGSFGIEALSRGARSVVFVEQGRKALETLRANLDDLGLTADVIRSDVKRWLTSTTEQFDIVFCDPPWPMDSIAVSETMDLLRPHLDEDGLVVLTRRASDPTPEPAGFAIDDERRHGDTRIIRYVLDSRT